MKHEFKRGFKIFSPENPNYFIGEILSLINSKKKKHIIHGIDKKCSEIS